MQPGKPLLQSFVTSKIIRGVCQDLNGSAVVGNSLETRI